MMPSFLSSRYYLKFNLDRDPFPQKSRKNKLFLTHELTRLMDQLICAIKTQEEMLVVDSMPRGGKSVLAEYLNYTREPNWYLSLVNANDKMSQSELAHAIISQHFPRHHFDKTKSSAILHEFLQLYQRNGKLPVVVIDDAHLLPRNTLKFALELSKLRHEGAQFRVILFADKSITRQIDTLSMKEGDSIPREHMRIPSLSKTQTIKYMEHRLSLAGTCALAPFDSETIEWIYRQSAGIPGEVHKLAKLHMQDFVIPGRTRKILFRSTATIMTGLIVFVVTYAGMSGNNRQSSTKQPVLIALELPSSTIEVVTETEKLDPKVGSEIKSLAKSHDIKKKTIDGNSKKLPKQNNRDVLLADMKRQRDLKARKIAKEKALSEMRIPLAIYDKFALRVSDVVQN
jgi:type II secretory pathway predicted ATPase ExeA